MKSSERLTACAVEAENSGPFGYDILMSGRSATYMGMILPRYGDWESQDHCRTAICLAAAIAESEGD